MPVNISFIPEERASAIASVAEEPKELVDVLQKIVRNAGALLEVRRCSIALLDTSGTSLVTLASLQDQGHKTRQSRFHFNEGVAGWVAAHRQPLVIDDVSKDQRFKRLGRSPVGSMLCVPLIHNGQFVGTLTASSQELHAFDERKAQMLQLVADQAVLAITGSQNAQLAKRHADQLEMLLRLSRGISTQSEPESMYRTILSNVLYLVPCEKATMLLYQAEVQELYPVASWSQGFVTAENEQGIRLFTPQMPASERPARIGLYHPNSLAAWAALHRHPLLSAALPTSGVEDEGKPAQPELAVPFISRDELYGVLVLQRQHPFSSEELRLMRNLGNIAAAALENVTLFHKVRSEREQLRAILTASSDGIALLDSYHSFIEVNGAFCNLFSIEQEQVLGMECIELLQGSEVDEAVLNEDLRKVQQALDCSEALPYTEIDVQIKGVPRSLGISLTPVASNSQLILFMVRDVTAVRDAMRLKANFLSMITHELRSPLNAINGYLDLTLNGIAGELNEQHREFLQRARAGSEHLYALIEDLLLVARADAGQLRLNRQVISLPDVIDNAVEEMEFTAVDNGIALQVQIDRKFPRIYADAVRIQQVLRNLLNNALRFTPAGGAITVSAYVEDDPLAQNGADGEEVARVVKLSVSDTGIGIVPEYQQRIFERFFQVPNAEGARVGGQGLGLAIIKMIVELHGGSVMVESTPGKGSTFTCMLPCILS